MSTNTTAIHLYNTKTRRKELFTPINADDVRMYLCGPTVYDRAHIGNARPVIVFDVLNRLLRHVYGDDHVTYVRNFTDVDDRINETAQQRKAAGAEGTLEELIADRAEETINWYHQDMDALGAMRPDFEPRATAYIRQMVAMIEDLIAKGHAYAAEGHALFAVDSYADYGALSGRSVDDMIAGARVEVAPYKRNPMDFVLWKPSPDDLPGWESPWGRGRPGWHIECSAMSHELLGAEFDIHGGGNDLTFPHHENEIAQSTCAGHGFANVWMHNEMLQVEGRKMSKSLGNFFTVRDLLEQGVPGEVIRFVFLSTHYRKPMDWTEKKRGEAEKRLNKLLVPLSVAISLAVTPSGAFSDLPLGFQDRITSDLDTHGALATTENQGELLLKLRNGEAMPNDAGSIRNEAVSFLTALDALGLYELLLKRKTRQQEANSGLEDLERELAIRYNLAQQTKNFGEIDRLKSALLALGIKVQMSKEGVTLTAPAGFDPAVLEGVI